jgi:hypothetical protein
MSFLASSESSFGTSTRGSSFQYLTAADKEKLSQFENFRSAFASAKASKLAMKESALSTKTPIPYLHKAYYKPFKEPVDDSRLPPYLRTIVKLQSKIGKWTPSSELSQALSPAGLLPNPPPETDPVRWACSLALACLRRHPEHIDELRDCYLKGLEWSTPGLVEEAKGALPPRDAYYELDEEMVKTGDWKKSVQRSYELGGYQNFIPQSLKDKRKEAADELERELQRERERAVAEEERRRLAALDVDDGKIKAEYRREARDREDGKWRKEQAFDKTDAKRAPLLQLEYEHERSERKRGHAAALYRCRPPHLSLLTLPSARSSLVQVQAARKDEGLRGAQEAVGRHVGRLQHEEGAG